MADSTHECPGGCGSQVARRLLVACRPCWFRLPKPYRDAINAGYLRRPSDPRPHREALAAALAWYRNNHRGDAQ